jgi:inner membrane transporter RhtA
MGLAALLVLPAGVAVAGSRLLRPELLGPAAGVAALSSIIPYSLELAALRLLPTEVFALLMSLGPALAGLAGWMVLGQRLGAGGLVAMGLVMAANAGSGWRRSGERRTGEGGETAALDG